MGIIIKTVRVKIVPYQHYNTVSLNNNTFPVGGSIIQVWQNEFDPIQVEHEMSLTAACGSITLFWWGETVFAGITLSI